MITGMCSKKISINNNRSIIWLRKLDTSVFITHSYFAVPKNMTKIYTTIL